MIRLLYVSAVSACFERVNGTPYYAPAPFAVSLDGAERFTTDKNVFSLFHLTPDTAYTLTVSDEEAPFVFRTRPETFALNVKAFGARGDGVWDDTAAIQSAIDFLPEGGRLIFPEGTRSKKGNEMLEFHGGSFRCAVKAKCPVVPMAFIDCYKVLDQKGCKPVSAQIHYLEPIPYDEYKELKTAEVAELVKNRVQAVIDRWVTAEN